MIVLGRLCPRLRSAFGTSWNIWTADMQSSQEDLQKKNQELNDMYRDKNNKLALNRPDSLFCSDRISVLALWMILSICVFRLAYFSVIAHLHFGRIKAHKRCLSHFLSIT
jgi:hypothetical protein